MEYSYDGNEVANYDLFLNGVFVHELVMGEDSVIELVDALNRILAAFEVIIK